MPWLMTRRLVVAPELSESSMVSAVEVTLNCSISAKQHLTSLPWSLHIYRLPILFKSGKSYMHANPDLTSDTRVWHNPIQYFHFGNNSNVFFLKMSKVSTEVILKKYGGSDRNDFFPRWKIRLTFISIFLDVLIC